jgi:hypothetical protein
VGALTPARRIVLALAAVRLIGWLFTGGGPTKLPSAGWLIADAAYGAVLLVGLWFLWRPVWIVAAVWTALGELLLLLHPRRDAVLLLFGAAQLALLSLRQLRRELGWRPVASPRYRHREHVAR